MAHFDVFQNSAFEMAELCAAVNKKPHAPSFLGDLGIFESKSIRTEVATVEEREGTLSLISTSARGTIGDARQRPQRKLKDFRVPHVPYFQTLRAQDIQNIRAFGQESELEAVADVVNDILDEMRADHEATHEWHRIGAIKGQVLDADASTVIYNYFTEFDSITETNITFDFDPGVDNIQLLANQVIREMSTALGMTPFKSVLAICGDRVFDALLTHATVEAGFTRWNDSAFFRESKLGPMYNANMNGMSFGGIDWVNYRGKVGDTQFVADGIIRFIPLGVPGLFKEVIAPADFVETANTRGQKFYAKQEPTKWNKGIEFHTQSNVLYLPTRPAALIKGTAANIPAVVPASTGPIVVSQVEHRVSPGTKVAGDLSAKEHDAQAKATLDAAKKGAPKKDNPPKN